MCAVAPDKDDVYAAMDAGRDVRDSAQPRLDTHWSASALRRADRRQAPCYPRGDKSLSRKIKFALRK